MLHGPTDEEMNSFMDEHPTIIPLFEIDVISVVKPYVDNAIHPDTSHKLD